MGQKKSKFKLLPDRESGEALEKREYHLIVNYKMYITRGIGLFLRKLSALNKYLTLRKRGELLKRHTRELNFERFFFIISLIVLGPARTCSNRLKDSDC